MRVRLRGFHGTGEGEFRGSGSEGLVWSLLCNHTEDRSGSILGLRPVDMIDSCIMLVLLLRTRALLYSDDDCLRRCDIRERGVKNRTKRNETCQGGNILEGSSLQPSICFLPQKLGVYLCGGPQDHNRTIMDSDPQRLPHDEYALMSSAASGTTNEIS